MLRGLTVTLLAIVVTRAAVAQELGPLRRWIPEDINAVAIVRSADLLKSARAVSEGWGHSGSENFLGGAFTLPPDCELYLRATRFRPGGGSWSAALLEFTRPVDIRRVAEQEQSVIQTILSHEAVLSRRNCYFAVLTPELLGVVSPAHRQDVARWIERGERKTDAVLNQYLDEVLLGQSAGVTMAIDLTEMFEPERLSARLVSMGAMIGKQGDVQRITARVMEVRGLRLDVFVTDQTRGVLTLDFSTPIGSDGPLMQKIVMEAMGDLGVSLDSFARAEGQVEGKSLRMAAPFSDEDLRRVMTLILSPHPATAPAAQTVASSPTTESSKAPPRVVTDNNVKYFRAIDQILMDLTKANRNAKDYHRTATWHDNFASKIDGLSTLAVDGDLVAYGASVSAKLRSIAASLRGVAVDVNTLNNAVVYNTKIDPGWEQVGWWTYGYKPATWQVDSNLATIREKQADAVMAGSKDRDTIWQMINDERARTLAVMVQRYGESFATAVQAKK